MDGNDPLLARGLSRRFGARAALERVDLDVRRGEAVAVFGANGAGKTTLARIVASSLKPTSGRLLLFGQDARRLDRRGRARLGFVGHSPFLYGDLTAHENLVFFGRLHGLDRPGQAAETWLAALGLAERADDPVRTLSRGLQQRVTVARALVHDPSLVVLDEPFSALDRTGAELLERSLRALPPSGRSFLLVTHDFAQGLALCGRWLLLVRGRLAAEGPSSGTSARALERTYDELGRGPESARAR